jgi:CheY-like chemotaxis protein
MQAILLAEHDQGRIDRVRPLLELAGYRVITAANGAEALERLQHGLFELLIAALALPRMDGPELVRRMRLGRLNSAVPAIVTFTGDMPDSLHLPENTLPLCGADIDFKLMPMVRQLTRKE